MGNNYSVLWPKCTREMAYYYPDLDDCSSVVLVAAKFELYSLDFQCHVLENCIAMLQTCSMSSACKLQCYVVHIFYSDSFRF